ncbi:MAG: hypothetical protein FIB02_03945 [Desulfuromonas sp.]|nr:hypothetical protein [Desulfuromonas sp.]
MEIIKKYLYSKTNLIVFVAIMILGTCIHIYAINSEPYNFTVTTIEQNSDVVREVGQIESCRLAFWGYKIMYSGSGGNAKFKIYVVGNKGEATVYVKLIRANNEWSIQDIEILR